MNKRQKEVINAQLEAEKEVLKKLEQQYQRALNDIDRKIRLLQSDELTQSKIYQLEYQKALKGQISGILDKLHGDEYTTIQEYLKSCYTDSFIGTMYDMAGQGIPLIMPIDQEAAIKAIQMDSKISEGLYNALGVDTKKLKKAISAEVTRGIAANQTFHDIARNIASVSKAPMSRAKVIANTEGHRIQQASAFDAQKAAKAKGADVVKQWDSTLDGRTRATHRHLDGQIREVDKPFEADGKEAMFPGDFGDPAEDCNCRCVSLTRAKWALDEAELQTLKDRAKFFGVDKTKNFEEYKENYLKTLEKDRESGIIKSFNIGKSLGAASKNYPIKLPGSNQHTRFAEGQEIEGAVFAGKGTDVQIRDRFRLESDYHIPADKWQKVSGNAYIMVDGEKVRAELHWYEADGEKYEIKVKRYL
ncbi:phage minor head protein [Anaerotignum sp.]